MVALLDYDDMGLCNCPGCGRELIGERTQELLAAIPVKQQPVRVRKMPHVFGRLDGRPYCQYCYNKQKGISNIGPPPLALQRYRGGEIRGR